MRVQDGVAELLRVITQQSFVTVTMCYKCVDSMTLYLSGQTFNFREDLIKHLNAQKYPRSGLFLNLFCVSIPHILSSKMEMSSGAMVIFYSKYKSLNKNLYRALGKSCLMKDFKYFFRCNCCCYFVKYMKLS